MVLKFIKYKYKDSLKLSDAWIKPKYLIKFLNFSPNCELKNLCPEFAWLYIPMLLKFVVSRILVFSTIKKICIYSQTGVPTDF